MGGRPSDPPFDVAVVGSGPAGLAIVSRLVGRGLSLALIEAGSRRRDREDEEDSLGAESLSGHGHPAAHLFRRRMLGGASTVWGGRCIPFDRIDFRSGGGGIGWPVDPGEIERHLPAAADFLDCGAPEFDEAAFDRPLRMNRPEAADLELDTIERFSRPTDLWEKLRPKLEGRRDLRVLAGHLVTSVELCPDGSRVEGLRLVDRASGIRSYLRARHVVLACGGIETARLLLASRDVRPEGIGNHSDHLGRHYMTHVIGDVGELHLTSAIEGGKIDYRRTRDGIYGRSLIRLTDACRLRERLPNALWRPAPPPSWDAAHRDPILSAVHLAKLLLPKEYQLGLVGAAALPPTPEVLAHLANILREPVDLASFLPHILFRRVLARRKLPSVFLIRRDRRYRLEMNAEQMPDPQSRITLGTTRDRWGMPRIRLHWHLDPATLSGVRANLARLEAQVAAGGIGQFLWSPETVEQALGAQGGHHIGTARMSARPEDGVVDPDGTVWGVPNLHLAGAAVFPTSGAVNPTLLLTCLAFRLAGHLGRRLTG